MRTQMCTHIFTDLGPCDAGGEANFSVAVATVVVIDTVDAAGDAIHFASVRERVCGFVVNVPLRWAAANGGYQSDDP